MIEPITPEEAFKQRNKDVLDGIILVFNELIVKHLINGVAEIRESDISDKINNINCCSKNKGIPIYYGHWSGVVDTYKEKGWYVTYDASNLNQYDPIFIFKVSNEL